MILLVVTSIGWIATAVLYWLELHAKANLRGWLDDEIKAHEKTKEHLREAAQRMRRENRERVLGLIESQRV